MDEKAELKPLLERYLEVVNSERNQANRKYWENADERYLVERWRGRSLMKTGAPFTMALDISGYAPILGFDCKAYYSDPHTNLKEQLRYGIWEFEHLQGHRYFENAVFGSVGSVFEAAMFGAEVIYRHDQAPWYNEKQPVITDKAQLLSLKPFDFYSSGLCPDVIRIYEHHKKQVESSGIEAMFPLTMRSPFSVALMLRGFENLLIDIYDDPEFFADLMATVTGYLKEYSRERARYLGEPQPRGLLFNDEISTPVISPKVYEEMILPYELELAKEWGGVRYWHSCGKTEAFYNLVAAIPGLQMMHIGPWSDIGRAAEVFGPKGICLDICVNSVRDMYEKTPEEMRAQLEDIRRECDGKVRYSVRCDGIAILGSEENCMKKIAEWGDTASEVFPGVE